MSLSIPQSTINATVGEDILLSVDYSCHGVPTIEWKYTSNWGVQKIVEWKPGTQANVSQSHKDRVCTFDNGSIQLFSVGVRDSGYYVITVTEHPGSSQFGTIVLHVSGKTAPGAQCPTDLMCVGGRLHNINRLIFPFPHRTEIPLRGAPASARAGSIPGTRALLPDHPTPNKDTLWDQVGVGPLRPHPSTEGQMGGRRPQMLPCLFSIHPGTQNRLIHPWACSGLHPILL